MTFNFTILTVSYEIRNKFKAFSVISMGSIENLKPFQIVS